MAGTLTLLDDLVTNTGGTVTVDATDTLDLTGGDTINDGQFNNAGTVKVTGTGNEIENETGGTAIGSRHQQPDQYRDAGSGRHADACSTTW